jgi:hypothetical protein
MGAIARMDKHSPIANAMHSGMTRRVVRKEEESELVAPPNMVGIRHEFPAPVKKDPAVKELRIELKKANERIDILEGEKQKLIAAYNDLYRAHMKLKNTPSPLGDLLKRRGFTCLDELEKFIMDSKESIRKRRIRQERYNERHYGSDSD